MQKTVKSIGCDIDLLKIKGVLSVIPPVSLPRVIVKGNCHIGAFSYIGSNSLLREVQIGNYCSIASDVVCGPNQHPIDWLSTHSFVFGDNGGFKGNADFAKIKYQAKSQVQQKKKIVIGNDVWIGLRAIIMGGVKIGDGAIIAANSVVTKDVEPYSIVGGAPAKLIRKRFTDNETKELDSLVWWNYFLDSKVIQDIDYSKLEQSIIKLRKLINDNKLNKFKKKYVFDRKNGTVHSVDISYKT